MQHIVVNEKVARTFAAGASDDRVRGIGDDLRFAAAANGLVSAKQITNSGRRNRRARPECVDCDSISLLRGSRFAPEIVRYGCALAEGLVIGILTSGPPARSKRLTRLKALGIGHQNLKKAAKEFAGAPLGNVRH